MQEKSVEFTIIIQKTINFSRFTFNDVRGIYEMNNKIL